MLAPLLLGTGMMLRSIRSNASIIFPRICVLVVLLYVLWFANSVVQNTVVYLRRQVCSCRFHGIITSAPQHLIKRICTRVMLGVQVLNVHGGKSTGAPVSTRQQLSLAVLLSFLAGSNEPFV